MAGGGVPGAVDDALRVAILGGGVAGLSAAHELCERGFEVTIYEKSHCLGGKARSWLGPDDADDEPLGLPAEHGFRFFPGFYTHITDTMRRIPDGDTSAKNVLQHLVDSDASVLTDRDGNRLAMSLPTYANPRPSAWGRLMSMWAFRKSLPGPLETALFAGVLARLATSCEQRWLQQLEHEGWMDIVMPPDRKQRSEKYRRIFAVGLTRSFVATKADEMSAATAGRILLQLLYDSYIGPPERAPADRVLDGPTSEVWIKPWTTYLAGRGVKFELEHEVTQVQLDPTGRISGFEWRATGPPVKQPKTVTGFDDYIVAVPCEALKQLLVDSPELIRRDPRLAKVFQLETRWMNGIVFGVPKELKTLPKGHVLCLDSEWALTAINQSLSWSPAHRSPYHERWPTILSVDISDWTTPGKDGIPAEWCQPGPPPSPRLPLAEEVWRQLRQHLPELAGMPCPEEFVLDVDVKYAGSSQGLTAPPAKPMAKMRTNDEPLLVNLAGSWQNRPQAKTAIANLFLAADYVQTYTDFASMEAANEAARRAVNALLDARGLPTHDYPRCRLTDLQQPKAKWFSGPQRAARIADGFLFRLGLRAPFRIPILLWITRYFLDRLARAARGSGQPAA